jgi:hypothetical protein
MGSMKQAELLSLQVQRGERVLLVWFVVNYLSTEIAEGFIICHISVMGKQKGCGKRINLLGTLSILLTILSGVALISQQISNVTRQISKVKRCSSVNCSQHIHM